VYRLRRSPGGDYVVTLPDSVRGPIEFKFTLGSWESVEADSAGGDLPNREAIATPGEYVGRVSKWRDPKAPRTIEHTAGRGVSIVSDTFDVPQLGRKRRVWIYLPPRYSLDETRYPVLYMHDGQNVFDKATSFAGEWGVDETLDSLVAAGDRGVIVVAVDHGGTRRLDEYSQWRNVRHGGGEGDRYLDFLVRTLKPFIDSHYRTLSDRANTAIAGSSMGGLISLYAVLKYPNVFQRAGIFSPALWFAPEFYDFVLQSRSLPPDLKLYFISGALEGSGAEAAVYASHQQRMVEMLMTKGLRKEVNIVSRVIPDGRHSEWFWRREFPAAYRWMFSAVAPGPAPGK
jgi:metallo-beta-lactamase class B